MRSKVSKSLEERKNGYLYSAHHPGWVKRNKVPAEFGDNDLKRIILFYVFNTPCEQLSTSSIPLKDYGWTKTVWQNNVLKDQLFDVAKLKRNKTFAVAKIVYDMKDTCQKVDLAGKFQEHRDVERIAIYKPSNYPEFMAIFYHIRNALAHGRLAMYKHGEGIVFILEDGVKRGDRFQVRSRMVLKKRTLLKWIDIIESGPQTQNESDKD